MKALLSIIFGSLFVMLIVSYVTFSYGFLVFYFWKWFLMPVFPSLLYLTIYQAMGISMFIGLFKTPQMSIKKEFKDESPAVLVGSFFAPWITLLLGLLVKTFIIG
jgi:hypothetical protein